MSNERTRRARAKRVLGVPYRGGYGLWCDLQIESNLTRLTLKSRAPNTESSFRPVADDFKRGFHLEVGDPPKPTDRSLDGLKANQRFDLPTPGPQGQRRRVVATYEVGPSSEHIGACGMSGYPSPNPTVRIPYPEEGGSGHARNQ